MSILKVKDANTESAAATRLQRQFEDLLGRLRHRAYEIFERRAHKPGSEMEDWLRAEEELLVPITPEVTETSTAYTISLPLSGIESKDLEVYTMSDALIITGTHSKSFEATGKSKHEVRSIFCQWPIPANAVVTDITAETEQDRLTITIPLGLEPQPAQYPGLPEQARAAVV